MNARRDRRLVMGELLVVGQVAAEMPDRQPDEDAAGDRQQDGANKQKANELDHHAQRRSCALLTSARCARRPPARRRIMRQHSWLFQGRFRDMARRSVAGLRRARRRMRHRAGEPLEENDCGGGHWPYTLQVRNPPAGPGLPGGVATHTPHHRQVIAAAPGRSAGRCRSYEPKPGVFDDATPMRNSATRWSQTLPTSKQSDFSTQYRVAGRPLRSGRGRAPRSSARMPKRMLIDAAHPEETRVVVLNGTRLEEFDFESSTKRQVKGTSILQK